MAMCSYHRNPSACPTEKACLWCPRRLARCSAAADNNAFPRTASNDSGFFWMPVPGTQWALLPTLGKNVFMLHPDLNARHYKGFPGAGKA